MFQRVLAKIFGNKQDRDVKRFQPIVEAVNLQESEVKRLSDAELQ